MSILMVTPSDLRPERIAPDAAARILDGMVYDKDYIQDELKRGEARSYDNDLDAYEMHLIAMVEHPDIREAMKPRLVKTAERLRADRGFKEGEVLAAYRAKEDEYDLRRRIPKPRPRAVVKAKPEAKDRSDIASVRVDYDIFDVHDEKSTDGGWTWKRVPWSGRKEHRNHRTVVTFGDGEEVEFDHKAQIEVALVCLGIAFGLPYFVPPWFGASWGAAWAGLWTASCAIVGIGLLGATQVPATAKLAATLYGVVRGAVLGAVVGIPAAGLLSALFSVRSDIGQYAIAGTLWLLITVGSALHFRHHVGARSELLND